MVTALGLAFGVVVASVAALGGPITLVSGAILAAIAIYQNWDEIVQKVRDTWNAFGERFPRLARAIEYVINTYVLGPVRLIRDGISALVNVFENFSIEAIIMELRDGVVDVILDMLNGIADGLERIPRIGGKAAEAFRENVVKPFEDTHRILVGASIVPDMVNDIRGWMEQLPDIARENAGGFMDETVSAFQNTLNNARDVSSRLSETGARAFDGFADALTDFVTTGMADFGALARSIIRDIIQIQIRAQLAGIFGGAGGGLGSLFGGFFQDGGRIPSGRYGIVGEAGPELVRGPATVTSTDDTADLFNGGGGGNTTYNITALDSRSFQDYVNRPQNREALQGALDRNSRDTGFER